MSTTSGYREKVQALQNELRKAESALGSEKCIPTSYIAAAVAPVLIFLVLFFLSPSFVQRKEGSKYVRDMKRVFAWTTGLTVVLWIGMYLFTYCAGWEGTSVCARV